MKLKHPISRLLSPQSFRGQLLSRFLFFMAGILIIIGAGQYFVMRNFIYENKAVGIQNQILSVSTQKWQREINFVTQVSPDQPSSFFFLPDSEIAFIDPSGAFFPMPNLSMRADLPPLLTAQEYEKVMKSGGKLYYKILYQATEREQLLVLQPIMVEDTLLGLIQVSVGSKNLEDMLIGQVITFLPFTLLALVLGMLAFVPVLRRTLVPLSNIVDTVEQIDAGNLAKRFPPDQGQMEIDRLAASFNGMLERLELSFATEKEAKEQMRRFIADASHELRTPLTSIHGFLEVLLRGAMNQPDKLSKSLTSMYNESERMNKLVQDLLLLAQLDRSPHIQFAEGDLARLIWEMEPQLRLLAGNRKVKIKLASQSIYPFDVNKMKQVVLNLFQNAVQHTDPEEGEITLSLFKLPDRLELVIQDNGSGIPEEHLPFVFDRFYRSESSRTRKYGGAGLGLAISKSIVERHGGTIRLESCIERGSKFTIALPFPTPPFAD